jgi:hypothetical protein
MRPQSEAPRPRRPRTTPESISHRGGVDLTTAYFFRGYNQEDQGVIVQPYFNSTSSSRQRENPITGYIGTWNSFHSEKTSATTAQFEPWYESDLYGRRSTSAWAAGSRSGGIYTMYTYPNGAFDTIEEVGVKLGFDDTDKFGLPFALKPYVGVYFETTDKNGTEDTYLEFGIAPTVYTYNKDSDHAIALSVPVTVGASLDDYYFDDDGDDTFLGYVSVGLAGSMPIAVWPVRRWSLNGSVTWMQLIADGLQTANHDDDYEIIGKIGVSFTY